MSQCTDIFKKLIILTVFHYGNLKNCLMKFVNATFGNRLAPALSYICNKTRLKFDGICLKQDKITFTHEKNSKHIHCV